MVALLGSAGITYWINGLGKKLSAFGSMTGGLSVNLELSYYDPAHLAKFAWRT